LKKLSLLIVFLYSSLLYAQLQDSHFYKVSADEVSSDFTLDSHWKTHVEGSILKNIEGRERLMKIKLYGKFNLKFNSYLSGEFEPYLVIKEGEIQKRYIQSESSVIQMRQGFFQLKPLDGFSVQIGAINQEYLNSPLLVSDHTFLSALFGYLHIKEKYEVQTVIQQSMPSVVNSFKRINEITNSPYLTSWFNYGELIPSDFYSFKGHITAFYFNNLPSFIAHQSKTYGNTVENLKSSAQFKYSYYGINVDFSPQVRISPNAYFSFGYNYLINFGAPVDLSWGERIYTTLDMNLWQSVKLLSRLEYFFNNADSAPSYFNSEIYGHNDRYGFLGEVKAFFPKGNFELGFRYVLSNSIQRKDMAPHMRDRQHSVMIFISSRYSTI